MASLKSIVNALYCLAKVNGKWEVCRFSQSSIIFAGNKDGEAVVVCKKKDKTRWKYFVESKEVMSKDIHNTGDKVIVQDDEGRPKHFFVVDQGLSDEEGIIKYVVAR